LISARAESDKGESGRPWRTTTPPTFRGKARVEEQEFGGLRGEALDDRYRQATMINIHVLN
jgi:hypothetical protein